MVVIRFVDIGGIVDHHCLEVVVIRFVDIGGILDQQNELQPPLTSDGCNSTNINKTNYNHL